MLPSLKRCSFFIALLFCVQLLFAQASPAFITDSLDPYIHKAMKRWQIPGLAIAITKSDSIVYAKGFGVRSIHVNDSVTTKTLFPIWSMGKAFTALALALLQEEKRLKLDDKAHQFLPSFNMADSFHQKETTVADLLAHRMGIETFQGDFLWSESDLTTDELLQRWAKIKPAYGLRTGFRYSNFGYLVAGKVIEQVSKQSWQKFIVSHILQPLEMKHTQVYIDSAQRQHNRAKGHTLQQGKLIRLPENSGQFIQPFGGIYSTAEDMAKWLIANANKGKVNGKQILPKEAFETVHTPHNVIGRSYMPNGVVSLLNYGLGWDMRNYCNKEVISHGGAYAGHVSMMGFLPEEQLGFVILTNSDANELTEALKWQVIDAYLGRPFFHYSDSMFRFVEQQRQWEADEMEKRKAALRSKEKTSNLKAYAGTYHCALYGNISVETKGTDTLIMKFQHHPNLAATLTPFSETDFVCIYNHPMFGEVIIPFLWEKQRVKSFQFSVHPLVEFTSYRFIKQY